MSSSFSRVTPFKIDKIRRPKKGQRTSAWHRMEGVVAPRAKKRKGHLVEVLKNGKSLGIFNSINEAGRQLGYDSSALASIKRGALSPVKRSKLYGIQLRSVNEEAAK